MGRDPESLSNDQLWSDHIVEIAPDGAGGGKVVWKWCFWDHLVQEHDESKPNFGKPSEHPGRLDINACPGDTDWIHVNSISYNAELDQILLSSPNFSEIFIIDHSLSTEEAATAKGDMVYRWGNSANYGVEAPRTLFGQHNCHWIPADHPGAGHVLCFNNVVAPTPSP